jgi:diguanylate cyclase (GGDEF)-like protein
MSSLAEKQAELAARLQKLRDDYSQKLPGALEQLEADWQAARSGWDPEATLVFRRRAHSMAGSAGTMGFAEVGGAARAVMNALPEDGTEPSEGDRATRAAEIDGLLLQLRRTVIVGLRSGGHAWEQAAELAQEVPCEHEAESNLLVYVVDDDPIVGRDLAIQLGYFGYRVEALTSLDAMSHAVHDHWPAAIIMDITFPEGPHAGPQAIAQLRKRELPGGCHPFKTVFVSSSRDLLSRLEAVRAGADAYFAKPLQVGAVADVLDKLTARRAAEPYRVLIVDDEPVTAEYARVVLEQEGMRTRVLTNPLDTLTTLHDFWPDLLLMDLYMPECSGLELAEVIRQDEAYAGVPIVFVSAETDMEKQLSAVSRGGDEFLTKPVLPHHLVTTVASRAERGRVVRSFITRDGLTGLLNQSAIRERLEFEVDRLRRYNTNTPLSVAIIDVDNFKKVNDRYGHMTGNRVLRSVARLLRQRLRRTDLIGRYGGEEFAVIFGNTDARTAAEIIDRIREDCSRIRHQHDGQEFSITFSAGVGTYDPLESTTALLEAADSALYQAKEAGRNRVCLAHNNAGPELDGGAPPIGSAPLPGMSGFIPAIAFPPRVRPGG